ncbi:recombinase family protein [Candidatus Daviesbacteria bacterium]|nr:recombinase family protein [Candidatus Daviesbacteria bacterium]
MDAQEQMKYLISARKSSESDERQIQSIPDQLNILNPLAEQRNLSVVAILTESGSAKKPGRVVFNQIIQRIRNGEANGIIAWDPSRLSRNATDTGTLIQLMDDGLLVEIVTPSQTFKNNPSDKMWFTFLCAQAKYENDNKSVNVKRALKQKAERGEPIGPPRPGYRSIPNKLQGEKGHEPNEQFPLMKGLFKKYLIGKCSVDTLVDNAKTLGVTNYKGKFINHTSMLRLLQDPYYCGYIKFKGELFPSKHLPMLTKSEFELMQDVLHGRSKGKQQKTQYVYGQSLIKCGECSYHYLGETHTKKYRNGKIGTFIHYRCSRKKKGCSQGYINAAKIEPQVTAALEQLDIPPEFLSIAIDALNDQHSEQVDEREAKFASLKAVYENASRKLDSLVEMFISPKNSDRSLLSDTEYVEIKQRLIKERELAKENLNSFDKSADEEREILINIFRFVTDIIHKFKTGLLEEKIKVLQTIGSNLVLKDRILYIQVREPFKLPREAFEEIKNLNVKVEPKTSLLEQPKLTFFGDKSFWYRVRESNP